MDSSLPVCANGVNERGISKKDILIQRHYLSFSNFFLELSSNKMLLKSLRNVAHTHQLVELHFASNTSTRRDRALQELDDSSPSLTATPPPPLPPLPPTFNLSVPPPALPVAPATASTSGRIRGLLSPSTALKRASTNNNIDLCSSASESSLSHVRVDPSIDLILSRFLKSLKSSEAQISTNQAELQRLKFTEDSQNGKRLMSRLRVLEAENEELTKQKESGRPAKVSMLINLRQGFINRMKANHAYVEKLIDEAESEVEVFTSTLLMLQQQLSIAHTTIEVLAVALESSRPGNCLRLFRAAQWPLPDSLAHLADSEEAGEGSNPDQTAPSPSVPPRASVEHDSVSSSSTLQSADPSQSFEESAVAELEAEHPAPAPPSPHSKPEPVSPPTDQPSPPPTPPQHPPQEQSPVVLASNPPQPIPSVFPRDPRLQRHARM
ncbi:unnamed protein product [Mesocestoides corti]|uniref:Uncharacterized protein n=1 Tax=Mesocestoides corti TaxID=53468 RepID=A0A0R3U752_MESCO|nr:unnamed protein product [Mesocestoides corti]